MMMAKRPTDTGTWEKPWFRKMNPVQKCAWMYLLLNCDFVGVWDADTEMADFKIGAKVDWEALKNECNNNIEVLDNGKWWVVDYCTFNYGDINALSKSSLQKAVHDKLVARGLWDKYLDKTNSRVGVPYLNTTGSVKRKRTRDKEQEEDKDFDTFWASYPRKLNKAGALRSWKARERDKSLVASEVMAAVANYTRACAGKEVQFVMHPTTFLGPALRWKDYLVTGSKYVPAAAATVNDKWVCTMCGKEYPKSVPSHIGGVCKACKEEKA